MTAALAILGVSLTGAAAAIVVLWLQQREQRHVIAQLASVAERLARGESDTHIADDLAPEGQLGRLRTALDAVRDRLDDTAHRVEGWSTGALWSPPASARRGDRLGRALEETERRVQGVLEEVDAAGVRLAGTAHQVSGDVRSVREAAQAQSAGTEQTATTMEEIASQIQGVAKNAEHIAQHVGQTTSSLEVMVTTNEQVARSGESLVRAVEDASATMETVATSVVSVASTAESLSRVAQKVAEEAVSGTKLLGDSAEKLSAASERTEQSAAVIERLSEQSREIVSIVKVIGSIADQTNMLALNAAIEAARAGDAGRGFAVVADEVRKLAERSMAATQEIGEVIEAVQKDNDAAVKAARSILVDIKGGVQQVVDTSAVLTAILGSIEEVTTQVKDVQQATQEQSFAASEVMKLVANMNDVTRRVVDATREQATSSRHILDSAQAITSMTQQVADATAQQKLAGDQILTALEHISQVAAENLATLERLGTAAESLAADAAGLTPLVRDLAPPTRRASARHVAPHPAGNGESTRRHHSGS